MNKLIFLGTGSAAHPTRQMTSLLFSVDGRGLLVDCGDGMGTVRRIGEAGMTLSSVNDVFLTHNHADHIIGMPHFLFVKLVLDPKVKVRVFGPSKTLNAVKKISFLTHDYIRDQAGRIAFIPVKPGQEISLWRGFSATGSRMKSVRGSKAPGYAYAFTVNGRKLMFTADTMPGPSITRLARGADTVIHECGGYDREKERVHAGGHSTARDAGELARETGASHLILTHFPRPENADPRALAAEARRFFSGKISLAEDLMIVPL